MTKSTHQLLSDMQKSDPHTQWVTKNSIKGTDLQVMRESNRLLVLNYVREHGPISRAMIARATGLSATTVSTIIDAFLQEDLVLEGATQRSVASSGRRVVPVHFNAVRGYILGVELGRTHLTMLLCDLSANVISRSIISFDTTRGAEICLPLLAEAMRTFISEQGILWSRIVGIGLGMPGPIDACLQGPIAPPRMPGWHNVNVRDSLAHELNVPVYLENNANLGALGESRYGAGQGANDVLYVVLGAGIGGGLIMDGKVYHGSTGSAGEIGHMTIEPQGPLCSCGKRGCLEVLAGALAIVAEAQQEASHALMENRGTSSAHAAQLEMIDVGQVVRAAQAGDMACKRALEHAGTYIGIALANLMSVLNPSLILLDGSTMRAGALLLEPIHLSVAAYGLPCLQANTRIMPGTLGENAVALGGIAKVLDAIFGVSFSAQLSNE